MINMSSSENLLIIENFTIEDFIIQDADVQDLNGGIRKKFTSLATTSTIFRWRFGDTHQNPIIETTENPYYHTFHDAGTYFINHQSCYPCGGQLVCSNGWCTKSITITPPGKDLTGLAIAGMFGFLIFKGIDCEDRGTKKECDELKDYCQWVEKEKKCARKCKEGHKLEKEKTGDIKRPFRLKCTPTRQPK